MELLQRLIEEGLIDDERADLVFKESEENDVPVEEILLKEGSINEEDLFALKADVLGIPFRKRGSIDIESMPDGAKNFIQPDSAIHYKMIGIGKTEDILEVGMVYPEDTKAKEALNFIVKKESLPYQIYLITLSTFYDIQKIVYEETISVELPILKKLVERKLLSKEDAVSIEERVKREYLVLEDVLINEGVVEENALFEIKSEILTVPIRNNINVSNISLDVLGFIHEDSARHYKMVPLAKEGDHLDVGMVYPENRKAQEALKFISRKDIFSYNIYLITPSVFESIIELYKDIKKDFDITLLDKLQERGIIDSIQRQQVEQEADDSGKRKEDILLDLEFTDEETLFNVKEEIVDYSLKKYIDVDELTEELADLVSQEVVEQYKLLPFGKERETVQIGMVYPEDRYAVELIDSVAKEGNFEYEIYLITPSTFKEVLKRINSYNKITESSLMDRLVEEGFLDKARAEELEKEREEQKMTREEVIIKEKIINEEDLFTIKSGLIKADFRSHVRVDEISEDLLRLIPEDSANYYKMAPIRRAGEKVEIGMVYPENLRAREALKFLSRRDGFSYNIYLISLSSFEEISKQYRTLSKEVGAALEDIEDMSIDDDDATRSINMDQDVSRLAEEAPIVKVVAVVLRNAIEGSASDIHIEPMRDRLKVRFRVDGTLYASLYLPINIHLAIVARVKILSGLKIDEQRLPQDGRFSTKMRNKSIDFRVATFPTTLGEKVVIRVLDPEKGLKSVDELGIMGRNIEILQHSIKRPTGMTLVTGPTGSGKTTTLYAVMKILNNDRVNIVTLEDPVEYFMDGINQSQVHSEIGYVFASGLRQILRQDPDIIMVGEIRDEETADLAVHAALTGHMVLSTIHTNSAVGVIPRLIDMGVKPFLIPAALNTAMSQRLVRRLCDKCKKQVTPTPEIEMLIREELNAIPEESRKKLDIPEPLTIYTKVGCKNCSEEGVVGRMAICEVLKMTPQLSELVIGELSERKLTEEAIRQGMITIRQDGMLKVINGYTTIEEVLRATGETI